SRQLQHDQVNDVNITIDTTDLGRGTHYGRFTIDDPNAEHAPKTIKVNVAVVAPVMSVSPTDLRFQTLQPDPCLPQQTISIRNSGDGTLNWHISIPPDCNWLDANPRTGRSTGEPNIVTLTVDASGLGDGEYVCDLEVIDPNADNSPKTVTVRLLKRIEQGPLRVPGDFPTIQSAVDWAFPGETVVVAPGTYTGPGNRDIQIIDKEITIRSIDPTDPCIVASTIIDCNAAPDDPHRGFYIDADEEAEPVLSGLTITNGFIDRGAAIYCRGEDPIIKNCVITRNMAIDVGGGIYTNSSYLTIENCILSGNSAIMGGGAIACASSRTKIVNCTIVGNTAYMWAPALYCTGYSRPKITNSILYSNSSVNFGYGISILCEPHNFLEISYSNIELGPLAVLFDPSPFYRGPGNIYADPCFVDPGYRDSNGTPEFPFDDIWIQGDYRLKSRGWRWDNHRGVWTWDDVTSFCIDAGNPLSPLGDEPLSVPADPNNEWGRNIRINTGAFGGTSQASIPPLDWALPSDYDNDGLTNFIDLAHLSQDRHYAPAKSYAKELQLLADYWLERTTWSGTIPSGTRAWAPQPLAGAVVEVTMGVIGWYPGIGAESHDVYFGTTDPPEFQRNQTETTFPLTGLSEGTTYYWRIDEVSIEATIKGPTWTFTTGKTND
ncbi:MAG: right-handed parallel beta-helix repeat-containing protein, partial [Planctomycetota bacterium]